MRIASYNIMSGGFNDYEYDSTRPQRLKQLQAALRGINADIIGLVDTFRWDGIFAEDEIAELFGYRHAICINLNDDRLRAKGHNNGLTILSNMEIQSYETITIATRDCLKARIADIDIYVTYLDDLSEDVRLRQVNALLPHLNPNRPSIIMGDLNTLTQAQTNELPLKLKAFYALNATLRQKMSPVVDDMSRGEVTAALEAFGLHNASPKFEPTMPSKLSPMIIGSPFLQLDYCFSNMQMTGFKVWRDDIFDETSDHYPISFEVKS